MDGVITQNPNVSQTSTNQVISEQQEIDLKAAELAENFSYDGFQVVRRELFAHQRDPSVVIRRDSIAFNAACIAGFEGVIYIQILVNPDEKKMVIRKCDEDAKDALRWCVAKPDKRKSRRMTNKVFSAKMYDLMQWSTSCRYKILGHKITYEDEVIYIFDLTEAETFMDLKNKNDGVNVDVTVENELHTGETENVEKKGKINARRGYLPEEWRDTFGLPVEEHEKALNINIREGYVEFETQNKETSGGQ